ncbi:MAG: Rpp14/Pop5 family protein [Candidatus Micrarchaeota archaeon]
MMREKKRYVSFKLEFERPLGEKEASQVIEQAVLEAFGQQGLSQTKVKLAFFNPGAQEGAVKCSLAGLEKTVQALALKTRWEGKQIAVRTVKTSGCVGKLKGKTK